MRVLGGIWRGRPCLAAGNTAAEPALGAKARASEGVRQVALVDIGRFGWAFEGSILDLAGLTDAHIARLPGSHAQKEWDEAYFRQRHPDLVFIRSQTPIRDPLPAEPQIGVPERPLLLSILDQGGYRHHGTTSLGPGKHLLLFGREDLALDPALWGEPAQPPFRELLLDFLRRREAGL